MYAKFKEMLTGRRHTSAKSYIVWGVSVVQEVKMTDEEVMEWNQKFSRARSIYAKKTGNMIILIFK